MLQTYDLPPLDELSLSSPSPLQQRLKFEQQQARYQSEFAAAMNRVHPSHHQLQQQQQPPQAPNIHAVFRVQQEQQQQQQQQANLEQHNLQLLQQQFQQQQQQLQQQQFQQQQQQQQTQDQQQQTQQQLNSGYNMYLLNANLMRHSSGLSSSSLSGIGNGANPGFGQHGAFPGSQTSPFDTSSKDEETKKLIACFNSGLSEMSEPTIELLRTLTGGQQQHGNLQHFSSIGSIGSVTSSMVGLRSPQLSGNGNPNKRKFLDTSRLSGLSPASIFSDEKKQRTQGANFVNVLQRPVMESSMEDIIGAIKSADAGLPLPVGVSKNVSSLVSVVRDKERRPDRFHKKKSSEIFKNPLKSLTKKKFTSSGQANSSGQGCTIVVVNRKCQKHARGCTGIGHHDASDIVVTKEPVTRSNFGKWVNSFLKSAGIA